MTIRLYRMSISTFWHNAETRRILEFEAYFKIARRGIHVRTVRSRLAKLGVKHFQNWLRRHQRISIPKCQVKVKFEREVYACAAQDKASVRWFSMQHIKKKWQAQELPPGTMSYVRRRRRKKESGPRARR